MIYNHPWKNPIKIVITVLRKLMHNMIMAVIPASRLQNATSEICTSQKK